MTTQSPKFTRPEWSTGSLYTLLMNVFPERRTAYNIFDVRWLCGEMGKSPEAIYKWFRTGRLTGKNARLLCELANHAENLTALEKVSRQPPTLRDFDPFVYA